MGTHSITLIRERYAKKNCLDKTSTLGGPTESKYNYEYFVCIYHHYDGYVEGGVGEWLAKFICKFISDYKTSKDSVSSGAFGAKLIKAFFSMSEFQAPRLMPIAPLKEIFQSDYAYAYIITLDRSNDWTGICNDSVMLSVYEPSDYILTARPEKFLEKYRYYKSQMEEMRKPFAEIDYGDNEVEKEGYLSEDQILLEFLE